MSFREETFRLAAARLRVIDPHCACVLTVSAVTRPEPVILPVVALSPTTCPTAAMLPFTAMSPAFTDTLPAVLLTASSVIELASVTVISPEALAARLAAARFRPIEPVAVALTASAVTSPAMVMLPAVAFSVTSAAEVLPFSMMVVPVSETFPRTVALMNPPCMSLPVALTVRLPLDVISPSASEPLLVTVMSPSANVASSKPVARLRSMEPARAVAETSGEVTNPAPEMLPAVALSVTSSPAVVPVSVMSAPCRYVDPLADTVPEAATVRLPPAVTDTLPSVLETALTTRSSASPTTTSPAAEADRLVAFRLRVIAPVAVAFTASPVTRPAPEMLPAVALSVMTPAPPAATLRSIAMLPPVSTRSSPAVTPVPLASTVRLPVAVSAALSPATTCTTDSEPLAATVTLPYTDSALFRTSDPLLRIATP